MTTFDLSTCRRGSGYVFSDNGPSHSVVTDDMNVLHQTGVSTERSGSYLSSFRDAFSTLAAALFLPLMYADRHQSVKEIEFVTELGANWTTDSVSGLRSSLDPAEIPKIVPVRCLRNRDPGVHLSGKAQAPKFESEQGGYWRDLDPGEIGKDKNDKAIVGRTWVERLDISQSWTTGSFIFGLGSPAPHGLNPGYVYVMRSDSHGADTYKIGLTRRSPGHRAKELSRTTATPMPFAVLAQWEVGDCVMVEKAAHLALDAYRIAGHREFFRCDLRVIVAEIGQLVTDDNKSP